MLWCSQLHPGSLLLPLHLSTAAWICGFVDFFHFHALVAAAFLAFSILFASLLSDTSSLSSYSSTSAHPYSDLSISLIHFWQSARRVRPMCNSSFALCSTSSCASVDVSSKSNCFSAALI